MQNDDFKYKYIKPNEWIFEKNIIENSRLSNKEGDNFADNEVTTTK